MAAAAGGPVIVAFGGNALSPRGNESELFQAQLAREAVERVFDALGTETKLVLVHGNGPQVGAALLRDRYSATEVEPMSLAGHVGATQGSMGFLIELGVRDALAGRGAERSVAAVLSLVEVDADDSGLRAPTKPIGPFYSKEQAATLQQDWGWKMISDAGRGWRRVVPLPRPLRLLNADLVRQLVEIGAVVIAGGGGGIPLVRSGEGLELPSGVLAGVRRRVPLRTSADSEVHTGMSGDSGSFHAPAWRAVDGVVDKDHTAALVGEAVGAGLLISLTAVDAVYSDFGTKRQRRMQHLGVSEARARVAAGGFPPGSMGPKISAAADFAERTRSEVLITSASCLSEAMVGDAGTRVHSDDSRALETKPER